MPESASEPEALRWCLMNGKISEAEYLDWATQTFEMPAVTGDFFTAPSDTRYWEAVKDLYPWSPGFFPLAEWEGVYLIACLEPPRDFKLKHPHRFVLASARHLLLLWDRLNPPSALDSNERAPESAPLNANVPVNDSGSDTFDLPDGILMNDSLDPRASEKTELHSFTGAEVPHGLDFNANSVAPQPKTPDGFVAANEASIPQLSAEPDGLLEKTAVATAPIEEAATVIVRPEAKRPSPPPPPPQAAPSAAPPQTTVPSAAAEPPSAAAAPSDVTVTSFTISNAAARPLASAQSHAILGALSLAHVLEHFDGAMVLTFDETGSILKPWKWSDILTSPENGELQSIDLTQPSAFRIVFRSAQAFHGRVYASPVNQAFANAFTRGKLPVQMSVAPIMDQKKWLGMLVGIAHKPKNFRQVLGPLQNIAAEVGKQMTRLQRASAA